MNLNEPIIIAGPCSIESKLQIEETAKFLSENGVKYLRGGTFKPRTNPNSFQGLGSEGVKLLHDAASKYSMQIITEILTIEQLKENYEHIDIIQIGSRNMMSYGLLHDVAQLTQKDKKTVILKRGFLSTIDEYLKAAKYLSQFGNQNIILCLRGIRTFEQINSDMRFTPDLGSILELKSKTKLPIIFDPSHAAGTSKYIAKLSQAALVLGANGLMIEVHPNPLLAKSDSSQQLNFTQFQTMMMQLKEKKLIN